MTRIPADSPTLARPRDTGRRALEDAAAALRRVRDRLDESFDEAAEALIELQGKVLTLGVGKSGHAAQKVAATLRSVGLPALFLNASDSLHGDLGVLGEGDVAMLFSKSGTTRELMVLVPHLRSRGRLHPSFEPRLDEVAKQEGKQIYPSEIRLQRHAYSSPLTEAKLRWMIGVNYYFLLRKK